MKKYCYWCKKRMFKVWATCGSKLFCCRKCFEEWLEKMEYTLTPSFRLLCNDIFGKDKK